VLGAQKRPRKSWMVWQEDDRYPNLIVEFLSDNTAKVDRTTKKALYQDTFKTPEYIWFHPHTQEFAGFRLVNGRYQSIAPNPKGWLWSQELQLYFGIQANKLRLFTPVGKLIPTPTERADRMAEMLRSLGVDPDNLI
jgi:Uma2 family endonuclease